MYYATDSYKHCGVRVIFDKRSPLCPKKVSRDKIVLSPQRLSLERNTVSFTCGDIACQTMFYAEN